MNKDNETESTSLIRNHAIRAAFVLSLVLVILFLPVQPLSARAATTQYVGTIAPGGNYGRVLFVGDSRTVDMFSDTEKVISGIQAGNMKVYARDAARNEYLAEVVTLEGLDSFDTLVTWMGTNDFGEFANYQAYYDLVRALGKNIVVCTLGPTSDRYLAPNNADCYNNALIQQFNRRLVRWANENGVPIIDLYYICDNFVPLDPADGVHYYPRPTTAVWDYINACMYLPAQ